MRLASLVRQEARLQIGSTRFRLLALASVLLAMLAVTIGARDFGFRNDQYEQRALERQAERVNNGWRLYGWKLEPTLRMLRPPSTLSVFVRGLDAVLPAYWDMSPAGTIEGPVDPSIGQDSEVGEVFDLESVIRIVLGLLALLLAVDSVAGQRATGTLHALMLQPIRPVTVVIAKLLAGAISLLLAIGLVLTAASVTVLFLAPELFRNGTFTFLATAGLIAWAYLMAMYAVGLTIGALAAGVERSTFVAIAIWTFVTLVAPQLVAFSVRAISPLQPRQAMERERQVVFDARLRTTEQFLGTILTGVQSAEEKKKKLSTPESREWITTNWKTAAFETRAMVAEHDDRYRQDAARQQDLTRWLARFSPGSLLIELTTDAAGTGRHAQAQWQRDLAAFQQQLNAALFDDRPRLSLRPAFDAGNSIESFNQKGFPMFSDLPAFEKGAPDRKDVDEERGNVAALLAFVVAGAGLALYLFPKSGL